MEGSGQGPQLHPGPPALSCALLSSWLSPLGTLKGFSPWKCFQFLVGLVEGGLNKRKKKKKEVKSAQVVLGLKALLMFLQAELQVFAWESGSEID